MRKALVRICIFCVVSVLAMPEISKAQSNPSAEAASLNQKAMGLYQNMKIDEAMELLQEAEVMCLQFGLLGHDLAQIYLNMGLIEAAGNQNETAASDYFTRASCIENSIAPDPLLSTPEVDELFKRAKAKAASPGTCTPSMIGGLEPPPPDGGAGVLAPPIAGGGFAPQSDNIRHTPVTEQVKKTPVPLFISVRPGLPVDKVVLFYRTYGERNYQQFIMSPMDDGYGTSIGCDVLQTFDPAAVEYYIGVMDAGGMILGYSGNEAQPHMITFVQSLRGPAPSLPNTPPPDKCMDQCPPWNPDCNAGACKQYGDLCDKNSDCCKGMVCKAMTCTPGEDEEGGKDRSGPYKPKFRLGFTFGTGGGYVPSTYVIPDNRVAEPPYNTWISIPANRSSCSAAGYTDSQLEDCFNDNVRGLSIKGGMAWSKLHFRLTPTFFITEKIMIGLTFRGGLPLALNSKILPVAPIGLINFGYRIVGKGQDLVELSVSAALGGGVMYHKVTFPDCGPVDLSYSPNHPWRNDDIDGLGCNQNTIDPNISEWTGPEFDPSAYKQTYFRQAGFFVGEVGMDLYLWVVKNFGLNIGIAVDILAAPNFAINGDAQLGAAIRF